MADDLKLVRVPINTHCTDPECKRSLPFGTWAYYYADSEQAICPECAVKRGWTSKERASQIIKELELREDIKALRKQRKVEADALHLLKEQIDLHRLGERDLELEQQIVAMTNLVQDYLRKCGEPEEKEALLKVQQVIRETQDLQKEVRSQVQSRLFLLERTEAKRKKKGLFPMPLVDEQSEED